MKEGESVVSIVEDIIRSYPELKEKMRSLKYRISSSRGKDPTASAAFAELSAEEQRRYQAISTAVQHTVQAYEDGAKRLLVIRAVYWNSALCINALKDISALESEEIRRDFVQAVSQRLGLDHCTGCIYWRKLLGRGWSTHACHYCYETGRLRSHDALRCYSKCLSGEKASGPSADDREKPNGKAFA